MDYAINTRWHSFMRVELPDLGSADGPLEFLIGIICNQAIRAETAWRAAAGLRDRLGHLDPAKIAAMHETELAAVIGQRTALHPFTSTMGRYITGACRVVCDEYDGATRAIWDDLPSAAGLIERFRAFPGVGKHKAEVALFLLACEYGVAVRPDRPLDAALSHCPRLADLFGGPCHLS
jgi:uncharacterized HhH-GPD family protein